MSVVGYCNLKHRCTKEINWESESELLIPTYKSLTRCNSEDEITDVNSFLTKLEERSLLGIDRLDVLKDLLKEMGKWDLLRMVDEFEIKRKDYKQFLEKISRALDESNELQRLILICKSKNLIAHEREEHIADVNALFAELEEQNNLGIRNLSILRTMATEVENPDLCKLVDDFDEKTKQEDDAERKRKEWEDYMQRARDQAVSVLVDVVNTGKELIGVLTPHCTFRNATGGAVVVTTCMVLRRSPSLEVFAKTFKEVVLPLESWLLSLADGSIRFTLQAENTSALDALWQSYQDGTLQKKLQKFLVTEEIKQLVGGEVTLAVHIDEEEYTNAMLDLIISGTKEMKLEEKRRLKDRASSDSDLLKGRKTFSEITLPSDSGAGTWKSATPESEWDKEPILTSPSRVKAIMQRLENCLPLTKGYLKNLTEEEKKDFRGFARKAYNLERYGMFEYLRRITPPGTTGPRLPDDMLIKELEEKKKKKLSELLIQSRLQGELDLSPRGADCPEGDLLSSVASRENLKTVGELYDFLCKKEMPRIADNL